MDVDISKWEKIAHGPKGDSTSKIVFFIRTLQLETYAYSNASLRAHKLPDYECNPVQSSLVSVYLLP